MSESISPEVNRSLKSCVKEGVFSQIMIGIFDIYLNPLAIFLRGSTLEIGLLASIPGVLSAFSQVFATGAVRCMGNRRNLLVRVALFQAFLILAIPFLLFLHGRSLRIELLIILATLFRVSGSFMGPAWGSMVSEYLPAHSRGAFFGRRTQIISIAGIIGMVFWGLFLFFMKNYKLEMQGFFVIFLCAPLFRLFSAYYMSRQVEVHPSQSAQMHQVRMGLKNTNFLFFVFYTAAITFATQMASPYTSVYMLRDLNFSYWSYMCVNFASMFTGLLSFPIWGRHADILGNLKVLKLTGWLIPWTPILYMFSHTPWQLSVVEVFNGFIWAGFNLCATNFIYDAAPPHKRVQYICYSNIVNGIALFSGASIGGVLGSHLPLVDGSRLFFLFMISSFFRLMSQWLIFPQVHEVRVAYRKVHSYTLFFSVLGIRPIFGRDVESPTLSRPFSHRFKMFFRAALRPR